jgi:pyruvate dehydrogenase E1 component beta subunit
VVDTTASELPFGKAAVRRVGSDVTLVAMGAMVPRALEAGRVLGDEGIGVEIIDLRTLVPMDIDEVLHSLEKTQRLVVVEEGCKTGGIGAEIAARVAEEALDLLDAPIKRVAAPDTPVPACAHLEQAFIPGLDRIVGAVKQIA